MQHQVAFGTITTALASAVHEWFLIFLLLIDATFSYLITKFASYSHLQIPCILCSRIDHILRNENTEFCWDLLCKKHKVKISSLVLCSLNQSLVDIHESPDFNGGRRQCSCCNEELVSRSNDQMVFDKMSVQYEAVELYKPLLATDEQEAVELKDITDVVLSQNAREFLGKDDLLPHVGYQKVNIVSDTESKASLSDDDSACLVTNLTKFDQMDSNAAADDTEKLIHPAVVIDPSFLESKTEFCWGRQLSGKLLEQISLKDSAKLSDDLKFLLSQLSFSRGNDVSSSDASPRVSGNIVEYMGMHILQRRASLERNVSGISLLDESIISEIEGESLVDRLKRQVEHDMKLMSSLYKELDEERNATTVAVNQAMAMITRLQEEKSSLQMEAFQCLRMMEEQAEYDNDNLLKTNDLLAEKEKETHDLEAELECYYKKNNKMGKNDLQEQEEEEEEEASLKQSIDFSSCSKCDETSKLKDFGNETLYILQHLQTLERKLKLFSNDDTLNAVGEDGNSRDVNVETKSGNIRLEEDLRNEFLVLSGRLKALETERNFLEQGISLLNKGDEGLKLILNIASEVRELHSIGFRK